MTLQDLPDAVIIAILAGAPLVSLLMLQGAGVLGRARLPRWAIAHLVVIMVLGGGVVAVAAFAILGIIKGLLAMTVFVALIFFCYWLERSRPEQDNASKGSE